MSDISMWPGHLPPVLTPITVSALQLKQHILQVDDDPTVAIEASTLPSCIGRVAD